MNPLSLYDLNRRLTATEDTLTGLAGTNGTVDNIMNILRDTHDHIVALEERELDNRAGGQERTQASGMVAEPQVLDLSNFPVEPGYDESEKSSLARLLLPQPQMGR